MPSTRTLGVHGLLTRERLEHASSAGEAITTLADTNVQAELLDAESPHGVLLLGL